MLHSLFFKFILIGGGRIISNNKYKMERFVMKTIEKIEECDWCKGKGYDDMTCNHVTSDVIIGEYGCNKCGGNGTKHNEDRKNRDYRRGSGKVKNIYEVTSKNCIKCGGIGTVRYSYYSKSLRLSAKQRSCSFLTGEIRIVEDDNAKIIKTCEDCNGLGKELRFVSSEPITSGCFVTTAICDILGKDDKCFELETLRKFRDNELFSNNELKKLVFEYYEISPKLVNKIINHEDKYQFAQNLLNKHINIIIQTINQGDKFLAIKLYQEMLVSIEEN